MPLALKVFTIAAATKQLLTTQLAIILHPLSIGENAHFPVIPCHILPYRFSMSKSLITIFVDSTREQKGKKNSITQAKHAEHLYLKCDVLYRFF